MSFKLSIHTFFLIVTLYYMTCQNLIMSPYTTENNYVSLTEFSVAWESNETYTYISKNGNFLQNVSPWQLRSFT